VEDSGYPGYPITAVALLAAEITGTGKIAGSEELTYYRYTVDYVYPAKIPQLGPVSQGLP
jgi:hypothetical protein